MHSSVIHVHTTCAFLFSCSSGEGWKSSLPEGGDGEGTTSGLQTLLQQRNFLRNINPRDPLNVNVRKAFLEYDSDLYVNRKLCHCTSVHHFVCGGMQLPWVVSGADEHCVVVYIYWYIYSLHVDVKLDGRMLCFGSATLSLQIWNCEQGGGDGGVQTDKCSRQRRRLERNHVKVSRL